MPSTKGSRNVSTLGFTRPTVPLRTRRGPVTREEVRILNHFRGNEHDRAACPACTAQGQAYNAGYANAIRKVAEG